MAVSYPASGTLRDAQWIKKIPSEYSPSQLAQYLSTIGYEPPFSEGAISSGRFPVNLESLERIMRLHLLTFPFEHTAMHYTADHTMDVTPQGLFHRLINEKKGSYCFGQNGFFLEVLRGLGFRAYTASGRVNEAQRDGPPVYTAPSHLVVLVQPLTNSNQTYLVDVGFGSSCITRPLLLSADLNNVNYGVSETERHRLIRAPRADSSLSSSSTFSVTVGDQWNLEVWHKKPDPSREAWKLLYSFEEAECWLTDRIFGSFGVNHQKAPTNPFWKNIICVKMFTVDEGNDHIERSKRPTYRVVLSGNEVRKHIGLQSEVIRTFSTEVGRIRALRETFGVNLKDEDAAYVVGKESALATSQ